MGKWRELTTELERLLRPRTFLIGFKRLASVEELENIPRVRRFDHRAFCQLVDLARTVGWTIGVTRDDGMDPMCALLEGILESYDGADTQLAHVWFATKEDAKKQFAVHPRIPLGEAIVIAPVASEKFDPDVILIYGTPTQTILLINGLQYEDYVPLQFSCVGETSCCASAIAECYLSGKPTVRIPCYGERRFGHTQEDELVTAIPSNMLQKAVTGLKVLSERGVRYPIVPYGAEVSPFPALARAFPDVKEFKI